MLRTIRFFLSSRKSWTIPYVIFSAVFVILPLLLIVVYAFMDDAGHFTLGNFAKFFAHPEAINTFVYSIGVAIITTVVCILLGYPAAYILTQMRMKYASTVVVLFILPMWVNILIRTLATVALFDFMNVSLGEGALIFGMVYNFLPFMIYPIYNTLQKLYNPQIQISVVSGTKRSIFRQKNKTKRSKKRLHTTLIKPEQKVNEDLCSGFIVS